MKSPLPRVNRTQTIRFIGLLLCLLGRSLPGVAQFSPSFESAYRTAATQPDAGARLLQLRRLGTAAESADVFQTIAYGKSLLDAATEVQSDTDRYNAHMTLCSGFERNRDFGHSVRNGLEAVRIGEQLQDVQRQARAFESVAFSYSSMGLMSGNKDDAEKAFYYSSKALDLVDAHHLTREEPYALTMAGDVNAMNSHYDTAIRLYRRAIAAKKALGIDGDLSTYVNLGIALNLNRQYGEAMAVYDAADSLIQARKDGEYFRAKLASNRAILLGDMGRVAESERMALDGLRQAMKTGATDIAVDMIDHLKNLYRRQGRYPEALVFSDSLAAVKGRMINAERTGQVAEMEARYEAGVKDEQIAGQQRTIRANRRVNMGLLIGIALLLLLAGLAVAGLRRSRRFNRRIVAQQGQLLAQKAELERVNAMKDQLFGLISHDVRVPLNSLMAYATLLDQLGDLPPEKIRQYNADLRQTLGDTAVLMENLLQFAKTQMHATQAFPEAIVPEDIFRRVLRLLQPAMDQKAVVLHTAFTSGVMAFADEDMTESILRNLVSNAVKFSRGGDKIIVLIEPCGKDKVCCRVADNGAGMDPAMVRMWNDNSLPAPVRSRAGTQQEKGSGLGLMLSKSFALLMGGKLQVESTPGEGAIFSLYLPAAKA